MTEQIAQLQSVLDDAIQAASTLLPENKVAVVAEYPAHLPPVAFERDELTKILTELITRLKVFTNVAEISIQADIAVPLREETGTAESGADQPLLLVVLSIADVSTECYLQPVDAVEGDHLLPPIDSSEAFPLSRIEAAITGEGGGFRLECEAGSGARILMTLPVQGLQLEADLSRLHQAIGTRLPEDVEGKYSILLYVEGTQMLEQMMAELELADYRVVSTPSIELIPGAAAAESFDLIILDLQSRDPTALDIALLLKRDRETQEIPVLFLATIQEPNGSTRIDTADYLARPDGIGSILSTVNAALHRQLGPVLRVMVVESSDTLREHMLAVIQVEGHPVIEARSAEEAVALAERTPVGLVFANAQIAQARDYWMIRQLRTISPDSEIFVLSETLSPEMGQAAVDRGASGYSQTGELPDLLDKMRQKGDEGEA